MYRVTTQGTATLFWEMTRGAWLIFTHLHSMQAAILFSASSIPLTH